MPTFDFTSPDGKSYSVEGPEGATKEQAFEILSKQLTSGEAKSEPAQAQPKTANMQSPQMNPQQGAEPGTGQNVGQTLAGAARDIGVSGGVGAAIGAAAPEIVTGLGMAAAAIPVAGEVLAPALLAAGSAMRAARVASAATGLMSGLMSETAGQLAEAGGADKGTATAIRFGAGMAAPGAAEVAGFVNKTAGTVWKAVRGLAGGAETTPKAVEAAREALSKAGSTQPQLTMHEALATGVEADKKASEQAANAIMADAHKRATALAATDSEAATRLVDDARTRADAIRANASNRAKTLEAATDGKIKTAKAVAEQADQRLNAVGQPREPSDIGNELRSKVTTEQSAAIAQRREAYKATEAERDAAVQAKEQAGQFVDTAPGMKELKADIAKRTLDTKGGQTAAGGKALVTEQGQLAQERRVYDAINNRRVQTGVDDNGNPKYQTFKTTFEALDAVRRKLGDAAFGKEAEGFEAIGQQRAKELYGKLSKIQEDYAGPAQKKLQSDYASSTNDMSKFGTTAGRKLTAVDRVDAEAFLKDPQSLPGTFFKSQQSIRDLRELTGDPALVTKAARDYVAKNLQGKSADQARAWVNKQSDWIREEPSVQEAASRYTRDVTQIERIQGKIGERVTANTKEAAATREAAGKLADKEVEGATVRAQKAAEGSVATQERIRSEGVKAAEAAKAEANRLPDAIAKLQKDNFPAEATRKLLTNGTPEEIAKATKYLAGTPGGKQALEGSVRAALRDMSPKQLEKTMSERVIPMLKDGGLLKPAEISKLQADVNRVIAAHNGKPPVGLVGQLVRAALATAGGQTGARAADKITGER